MINFKRNLSSISVMLSLGRRFKNSKFYKECMGSLATISNFNFRHIIVSVILRPMSSSFNITHPVLLNITTDVRSFNCLGLIHFEHDTFSAQSRMLMLRANEVKSKQ